MTPLEKLKSVLCNPDGKACIAASKIDLEIIDEALTALDAEAAPKRLSDEELEDLAAREFPHVASVTNAKIIRFAREGFIRGYRLAHGEEV